MKPFPGRRTLLIALDSVGIDPLGVERPESVYYESAFLFPKGQNGTVQSLPNAPVPGALTATDVAAGQAQGSMECALTYASLFTGRSMATEHGLMRGLALDHTRLEAAVQERNLFRHFTAPCLANALFPAHLPFLGNAYASDLLPAFTREEVEAGLRFQDRPMRLTGRDRHGFAELFTLAEINRNIFVYAAREARVPLRTWADVRQRQALTSSMTGELEQEFDFTLFGEPPLPVCTPEEAGAVLADLSEKHDFVFYKYQMPDLISHTGRTELARALFAVIERFVRAVLERIDPAQTCVVITSDHGHLEQVAYHRGHPKTTVPTWVFAPDAERIAAEFQTPEAIFAFLATPPAGT